MKKALHELIRSTFEMRIMAGELAAGDRLPTEQELMEEYGCSRMTVNKALSALVAAGLIDRRKRAGTFVSRPKMHSMVLDIPDLPTQLSARGQVHAYALSARGTRAANMDIAAEAWLARHHRSLLVLEGVHYADNLPLAYEYRLISEAFAKLIGDTDMERVTPGTWLLEHVPWTEAENRVSAVAATEFEARLLGLKNGAPCLCIERRTWQANEPVTFVRQVYVANAYDLVARFGPAGEAGLASHSAIETVEQL